MAIKSRQLIVRLSNPTSEKFSRFGGMCEDVQYSIPGDHSELGTIQVFMTRRID
jgi:hypothetical protein